MYLSVISSLCNATDELDVTIDVIDVILVFVKCYEAKGFCWVGSETMAAYLVLWDWRGQPISPNPCDEVQISPVNGICIKQAQPPTKRTSN